MNEDFWLIVPVALVWAVLGVVYALVPWGDMIGYAWVWGFGSVLFFGLGALLLWRQSGHPLGGDKAHRLDLQQFAGVRRPESETLHLP